MKTLALSSLFYDFEKKAFWLLVASMIVSCGAYAYFISASIAHVVLRKGANTEMATLNTRIGDLEAVYLERKTALNKTYATDLGFTDITATAFVPRTQNALTYNR